jgi:hypothetical protein
VKIALFGAGGTVARSIAREALARGHEVTGVVRDAASFHSFDDRMRVVGGDGTDAASIARVSAGADVIVSALSPRPSPSGRPASSLAGAARALLAGAQEAGVKRLVVVGGAGSLDIAPGTMLLDSPGFPDAYKSEAAESKRSLDVYRASKNDVDWTFVSPAEEIGPGPRTGHYRRGDDRVLFDATGKSFISFDDYAVALVDEIEHPTHPRARMTVAY